MDRMLALLDDHEPCLLLKGLSAEVQARINSKKKVQAPLLQSNEGKMRKLAEQGDLTWQGLKGAQSC